MRCSDEDLGQVNSDTVDAEAIQYKILKEINAVLLWRVHSAATHNTSGARLVEPVVKATTRANVKRERLNIKSQSTHCRKMKNFERKVKVIQISNILYRNLWGLNTLICENMWRSPPKENAQYALFTPLTNEPAAQAANEESFNFPTHYVNFL